MGIWDELADVVDDAKKFLDGIDGLGTISRVLDPLDAVGTTLQAAGVGYATSPPLLIGQLQIDAMKLTMGIGDPERAEGLESSAADLSEAGNTLVYADPQSDRWNGTAADAHTAANSDHRHHTFEIAAADKVLHAEVEAHADEVAKARRLLQDKWDFLSDFDAATAWMSKLPGLGQLKMATDTTVALEQTNEARITTGELGVQSIGRASRISALLKRYSRAAEEEISKKFGQCGDPFGDEHAPGATLPTRTQPTTPYNPPNPVPAPTTPVTPYESATDPIAQSPVRSAGSGGIRPQKLTQPSTGPSPGGTSPSPNRPASNSISAHGSGATSITREGAVPVGPTRDRQQNRPPVRSTTTTTTGE